MISSYLYTIGCKSSSEYSIINCSSSDSRSSSGGKPALNVIILYTVHSISFKENVENIFAAIGVYSKCKAYFVIRREKIGTWKKCSLPLKFDIIEPVLKKALL